MLSLPSERHISCSGSMWTPKQSSDPSETVSSCVISGKLGNLSELQLLSFGFLECMKGKLICLPELSCSALSTESIVEHTGCGSHWHYGQVRK